jgi:hypothetical protein
MMFLWENLMIGSRMVLEQSIYDDQDGFVNLGCCHYKV